VLVLFPSLVLFGVLDPGVFRFRVLVAKEMSADPKLALGFESSTNESPSGDAGCLELACFLSSS